jgi:hypothetical protein
MAALSSRKTTRRSAGWPSQATPLALFFLTTPLVFYVGWPILRGAWTALRVGLPNMDLLLALSILAAYLYSTVQLFRDPLDLYFEVAGTLVTVVTIGRYLERDARLKATQELTGILRAWSDRACVLREGRYLMCGLDGLVPGDRVFVRPGEAIPVDGEIVAGQGAIDESLMTGEAFTASRGVGERALGGSILLEGNLEIEVGQRVESRMVNLSRLLWNMQSAGGGMQGRVDRLARGFVPLVMMLSALVGLGFLIAGASPEKALLAGLATLIVSCPCTFGLAIPLTAATAVGTALRRGILVSSADLFEKSPRIDIVVLDKTGTLSSGKMAVTNVVGSPGAIARAAAVERHSTHPVARAIADIDATRTASEVELHPGRGAVGRVGKDRVAVGSRALFATLGWEIPAELAARIADHRDGDSKAGAPLTIETVDLDGPRAGEVLVEATAVAHKAGAPLTIETVDLEGPRAGEVLVEIKATGVCHTDAFTLSGADPRACSRRSSATRAPAWWSRSAPGVTSAQAGRPRHPALHAGVPPVRSTACRSKTNLCQAIRATQGQGLMPDGTSRFSHRRRSRCSTTWAPRPSPTTRWCRRSRWRRSARTRPSTRSATSAAASPPASAR